MITWGDTPLHKAKTAEQTDLLLKAGADPRRMNRWGNTPLNLAKTAEQKNLLKNYNSDPKEVRAAYIIQKNYRIVLLNKKLKRFKQMWFWSLDVIKYHPTFTEDPGHKILWESARKDLLEINFDK